MSLRDKVSSFSLKPHIGSSLVGRTCDALMPAHPDNILISPRNLKFYSELDTCWNISFGLPLAVTTLCSSFKFKNFSFLIWKGSTLWDLDSHFVLLFLLISWFSLEFSTNTIKLQWYFNHLGTILRTSTYLKLHHTCILKEGFRCMPCLLFIIYLYFIISCNISFVSLNVFII